MRLKALVGTATVMIAIQIAGTGNVSGQIPNPGDPTTMRFEIVEHVPPGTYKFGDATMTVGPRNGDSFENINAVGPITARTVADFISTLERHSIRDAVIHFDSVGGDLIAGLALGREIRRRGFATQVNRMPGRRWVLTAEDYQPTRCESACVYAFIGGTTRRFERDVGLLLREGAAPHAQTRIGLHQFRTNLATDGADAADRFVTGELGVSASQYASEQIASYVQEMGVTVGILELANRAPLDPTSATQDIYYPTLEELVETGVLSSGTLHPAFLTTGRGALGVIARTETPDMSYRQISLYCSSRAGAPTVRVVVSAVGRARHSGWRIRAPIPFEDIAASLAQPADEAVQLADELLPWTIRLSINGMTIASEGSANGGHRAHQDLADYSLSHSELTLPLSATAQLLRADRIAIEFITGLGTQLQDAEEFSVRLDETVRGGIAILPRNCLS